MPKYTPAVEKFKAKKVAKSYIEAGCSAANVARKRKTSWQAESKKIRRKPVQDAIAEFLNSKSLKQALIEVGIDGLKAEKEIGCAILVDKNGKVIKAEESGGITVKDHNARHKFWHDLAITTGLVKNKTENETKITGQVVIMKSIKICGKPAEFNVA